MPGRPALLRRHARAAGWLALAALSAVACGRVDRARQCARVSRDVNATFERIGGLELGAPTRDALEQAAAEYAGLAARLAGEAPTSSDVRRALEEYRKHLERMERSTRALAEALGDEKQERDARRNLELTGRLERNVTAALDAACHAP